AARSRSIEPSASHHNRTQLEATSIIESAPNPIKATLPASMPTVTPIIASSDVQVILRYSTRRPARVCRTRSSSSVMTVSCTSELNAIILPCCLEKSSPTLGGAREWVTGKVRSGITAIAVISQLRPEIINDSGGDFQSRLLADNPRPFNQLARIFQLTTIVQVALHRPLSTCHLSLPGKHSTRAGQRDDRLVQFARSRPGDRS